MVETHADWQNTLAATCRCITSDLDFPEPARDGTLSALRRHPMVAAFLERRSTSAAGAEAPIKQLRPLHVFSLHSGRHRGATWHQVQAGIVWLLAAHIHRDDSPDDAYAYFVRLQRAGNLLPTRGDAERVVAARSPRFDEIVGREIPRVRTEAMGDPGRLVEAQLGGRVPIRVAYEKDGVGLLVVAISTRILPGAMPLPSDWLGAILAGFFPHTSAADIEGVAEIGGEPLDDSELGFCALVDVDSS